MAPSKIANICRALCAATSTYLSRFPKFAKSKNDEEDDEWGILHAPRAKATRPQICRVQFVTKSHNVQVSLVLEVAPCRRAPPGLRLQRTRVVWTFSSVNDRSTRPTRFVQEPTFAVAVLASLQFDAYVSDRLDFAARRYTELSAGSPLYWTPRSTAAAPKLPSTPFEKSFVAHANVGQVITLRAIQDFGPLQVISLRKDTQVEAPQQSKGYFHPGIDKVEHASNQKPSLPWMRPLDVNPRYKDYGDSASYSDKRLKNIERRWAFQTSALTKDGNPTSTCILVDNWKEMQSRIQHVNSRLFAFEQDPVWQEQRQRNKDRRAKLQEASYQDY